MDHIITFLGWPSDFRWLFFSFNPTGLIILVLFKVFVIRGFANLLQKKIPLIDRFTAYTLGAVAAFSVFGFLLNFFMFFSFGLTLSSLFAWAVCLGFSVKYQSSVQDKSSLPFPPFWWYIIPICLNLWMAFWICGVDFGKVHFPIIQGILTTHQLPGSENFPVFQNIGYHYGHNLLIASYAHLFRLPAWIAEDIAPLFLCLAPLSAFRIMALNFGLQSKPALWVSLLSYWGTSIRLFLVVFLFAIYVFSGYVVHQPDSLESVRLFTRDYSLLISTAISQFEQMLLPGSQFGLPSLLSILAIFSFPDSKVSIRNKLVLSLIFGCFLFLNREDYLAYFWIGLLLVTLFKSEYRRLPLAWFTLFFLGMTTLLLGGVISESFYSHLPWSSPKSQNALVQEYPVEDLPKSHSSSLIQEMQYVKPGLATLSINNGRKKVPLYHPQLLIDLAFDYGPALMGLPFLLFLFRKNRKYFPVLIFPLLFFSVFVVFFDHPAFYYKIDLQRLMSYHLWTFFLLSALALRFQNKLKFTAILIIFMLSSMLAAIAVPTHFSKECWRWVNRELFQIGKDIASYRQEETKAASSVAGLNPLYTGMPSYAYMNAFNLHRNSKISLVAEDLYKKKKLNLLHQLDINFIVYPKSDAPSSDSFPSWLIKEYASHILFVHESVKKDSSKQ